MKNIITTAIIALASLPVMAQKADGYYTTAYPDGELKNDATEWTFKSKKWQGSFNKAVCHKSINPVDFYLQYKKNPKWKILFEWLQKTDMLTIPGGKHTIEGTDIVVSVEDSENGPLEKRRSESHYKKIDFQWVVKGMERFAILDHFTSTPNSVYRPDVIHYDYDKERTIFYDSTPSEFFIFFPGDWHIAKINNDTNDQTIRVIVAKMDYME